MNHTESKNAVENVRPATRIPRDAKPSELIRGWPWIRWCKGMVNNRQGQFCAIGILAEQAGFDWNVPRPGGFAVHAVPFIERHYGIPVLIVLELAGINDTQGKEAAADHLEARGF